MQYFYDIIFNFLLFALIHAYACVINNICHTVTTVIYDGYIFCYIYYRITRNRKELPIAIKKRSISQFL